MTDFEVDFDLSPREPIEASFDLQQRNPLDATFELNIISQVHNDLRDRDVDGCHPISSIVGLREELARLSEDIGNLENLDTSVKTDVVSAINSVLSLSNAKISDVLMGGTSIVTNTIARIPLATQNSVGVIGVRSWSGLKIQNQTGVIFTDPATLEDIYNKSDANKPITPLTIDYAVVRSLVDNYYSLTDAEKSSVLQWIGAQVKLTQNQQTAVDSGITSSLVGQITTNKNAISNETENRENADIGLQQQIDAITASSDVTDIVGTYAELQAYDTSTLPPNSIIKVLSDESRNNETTYYRWVITDGVGSWVLIGEEGPYYTKSQADETFVPQTRTVNGKPLSGDISLDANDVGAATSEQGTKADTALQPSALNGYATETWVGNQGYIKQAVDDSSTTSTTLGWSASKLNGIIGDIESLLNNINSGS